MDNNMFLTKQKVCSVDHRIRRLTVCSLAQVTASWYVNMMLLMIEQLTTMYLFPSQNCESQLLTALSG